MQQKNMGSLSKKSVRAKNNWKISSDLKIPGIKFCKTLLLLLFVVLLTLPVFSEDNCGKIRVAVGINIVDQDKFINFLNNEYPEQPVASWINQIKNKILAELKENSPDIEFVPSSTESAENCHYRFPFELTLIGAGEDIETSGVRQSEYTAFFITSSLVQNNSCGIQNRLVGAETTGSQTPEEIATDLFRTIEYHIDSYGSISTRIKEFEKSHPVPPREPTLEFALKREYVSPLKNERKVEIIMRVKNCKGELVYDKNHGQPVLISKKTLRGELKPTPGFPQGSLVTKNIVTLFILKPEGASVTYTLKKGMEMSIDTFKAETCGIGKKEVKKIMVPIAGIALGVEPDEPYVFPEGNDKIKIKLFKITPTGGREPLHNRPINISVENLEDGKITPTGTVLTGKNGIAILNYDAGQKDETVYVNATFQPKGYSDSADEKTSVTVIEKGYEWMGTVFVNETCHFEKKEGKDNQRGFWKEDRSSTTYNHTLHITVRFLAKPGRSAIITGKDVTGTSLYRLSTFSRAAKAECKVRGSRKLRVVKPGDWQKSVITDTGELVEKDLKVYPSITINRLKNKYFFEFGLSGLYWKRKMTTEESFYDACDHTTKNKKYPSYEKKVKFQLDSIEYKGHTDSLELISGSSTINKDTIQKCTTTYNWTLKKIKEKK